MLLILITSFLLIFKSLCGRVVWSRQAIIWSKSALASKDWSLRLVYYSASHFTLCTAKVNSLIFNDPEPLQGYGVYIWLNYITSGIV